MRFNLATGTLMVFAKFVEVNAHEVQVEEKRKQTDEVGSSQRLETSEQNRREIEIQVIGLEKSKQKATPASRRFQKLESFIVSKVELTLKELLGITKKVFQEVIIDVI